MAYILWSDVFQVGVPAFDAEHAHLVAIINRFHDAWRAGASREIVYEVLNSLVRYAEEHFAHEQAAFETHHYPERLRHRLEHDRLLTEVFELNQRLSRGEATVSDQVMEFLKSWLLEHILRSDRAYAPFLSERTVE